jgi:Mrp family chromosome partitioning ATPase
MSKIIEALQRAQRERREPVRLERVPSVIEVLSGSAGPPIPHDKAVGLFHSLEAGITDDNRRIVQFISPRSGEGVSTIVFELAKVVAEGLDRSVLILYDDRFHSGLSVIPSAENQHGLDEFLRGSCSLDEVLLQVSTAPLFVSNFSAKPSVPIAQIFGSSKMLSLLEDLRRQFDLILIDSPSLEVSADGLALASKVEGVVLVIEAERTPAPVARKAKELIIQSGGRLLGLVFNRKKYYIPDWLYRRL